MRKFVPPRRQSGPPTPTRDGRDLLDTAGLYFIYLARKAVRFTVFIVLCGSLGDVTAGPPRTYFLPPEVRFFFPNVGCHFFNGEWEFIFVKTLRASVVH